MDQQLPCWPLQSLILRKQRLVPFNSLNHVWVQSLCHKCPWWTPKQLANGCSPKRKKHLRSNVKHFLHFDGGKLRIRLKAGKHLWWRCDSCTSRGGPRDRKQLLQHQHFRTSSAFGSFPAWWTSAEGWGVEDRDTRPGKQTVCYWKRPFIADLPMKNGDFHWFSIVM